MKHIKWDVWPDKIEFSPELARRNGELRRRAEKMLKDAPEGSLTAVKRREGYHYFRVLPDGRREYVRLGDMNMARALAQKEYARRVLWLLKKREGAEQALARAGVLTNLSTALEGMHPGKRALVNPLVDSREEAAREWQSAAYPRLEEDRDGFRSARGERLRSKAEVIIADKLLAAGVPYRYEEEITLPRKGFAYPDFTVLNSRTGEVFYWEHFGMMGDSAYAARALEKINLYARKGILLGKGLLATFESDARPLDLAVVDQMIEEFLK